MRQLQMYTHGKKGALITFCGLDGCGKSTMLRLLADYLQREGKEVFLTKQPTDFVRQSLIFRTFMDEPVHDGYDYRSLSLLAASDRIQHGAREISPRLEAGRWVLSDRYFYSCAANLWARGFTEDQWINEISRFMPRPDLAFFLDVPVELAVRRVRSRPAERHRYIDMPLQYKLRKAYIFLSGGENGVLLASDGPEAETFGEILRHIKRFEEEKT